jgi:hypothetical protein
MLTGEGIVTFAEFVPSPRATFAASIAAAFIEYFPYYRQSLRTAHGPTKLVLLT